MICQRAMLLKMLTILPEFFSIKLLASDLLIFCNLPVNINDLFLNFPFLFRSLDLIFSIWLNFSTTLIFILFLKNFSKDLICVSPMPSIFINS